MPAPARASPHLTAVSLRLQTAKTAPTAPARPTAETAHWSYTKHRIMELDRRQQHRRPAEEDN